MFPIILLTVIVTCQPVLTPVSPPISRLGPMVPPPPRTALHRVWLPRLHAIVAQLRPVRRVRLPGGTIGRHAVTLGSPGYDLGTSQWPK